MPYQGDRHPADQQQPRFTTDFAYLRKLPGALILVQLACCFLGFTLALAGTVRWRVGGSHAFFTFVAFLSMLSCMCWLVVRVLHLESLFKKNINWNKLGLVHNSFNAFMLMVGSCLMLEAASGARTLRAAGVFGFLGFSTFVAGLVWEAIIWRSNKTTSPDFSTATVTRGLERSRTPESEASAGVAETAGNGAESVSFVGIKARPVSSFLEQQSGQRAEVSTPMLMVPQTDSEDGSQRSSASSVEGEWQMPASGPTLWPTPPVS